jgi:hypothetical protein
MELNISPNFNVDDIRKVRDYYYEVTKNMSLTEEREYFDDISAPLFAEIERRRAAKKQFFTTQKK